MALREAVVAVTYRCNLKCSMCNIWLTETHNELPPTEYLKLPETLRTVNITGGEPFLREDLLEVVSAISKAAPHARLVISTNGYLTNRIVREVARIQSVHPDIGVGISLDGNEDTHDRIRGVQGSYTRAVETARQLKANGVADLRFGMTIATDNLAEVESVYLASRNVGIEFTATYAHNSDVYFGKSDNPSLSSLPSNDESLRKVIRHLLSSRSPKNWFRAYHLGGIIDSSIRARYYGRCLAGSRYVFISPDGTVYPCNVMELRLGNLRDISGWNELMTDEAREKTSCAVKQCRRDCWMVCNTRSLIVNDPFRVLQWIVRTRLRNLVDG